MELMQYTIERNLERIDEMEKTLAYIFKEGGLK